MKRNIIAVLLLHFILLPGFVSAQSEIDEILQDSILVLADSSLFNADSLIMSEAEIHAQNSGEALWKILLF